MSMSLCMTLEMCCGELKTRSHDQQKEQCYNSREQELLSFRLQKQHLFIDSLQICCMHAKAHLCFTPKLRSSPVRMIVYGLSSQHKVIITSGETL